jgi:hypothetical protein
MSRSRTPRARAPSSACHLHGTPSSPRASRTAASPSAPSASPNPTIRIRASPSRHIPAREQREQREQRIGARVLDAAAVGTRAAARGR